MWLLYPCELWHFISAGFTSNYREHWASVERSVLLWEPGVSLAGLHGTIGLLRQGQEGKHRAQTAVLEMRNGDALEDPTSARGGVKKDGKQKVLTLKEYAWIQLLN